MIRSIEQALQNPLILRDILKKFNQRCEPLDKPPNPLVMINTPCILCSGPSTSDGYKLFSASDKRLGYSIRAKTHIVAFLLFKGARGNQQVQHLCGVRYCANYLHLTLGGPRQNGQHASRTRAKSVPTNKTWKLSEPDRIQIKTLHYVNGYDIEYLGEMFGVTKSTIYRVLKG